MAELDKALDAAGKPHEFHTYDGAGHAFFAVNRPAYRPEAANDGWQKIWDFYGRYLAELNGDPFMCTYLTENVDVTGSGKGAAGLVRAAARPPSTSTTRCTRRPSTR